MQIDFRSGILNWANDHSEVKYLGSGKSLLIFPKLKIKSKMKNLKKLKIFKNFENMKNLKMQTLMPFLI